MGWEALLSPVILFFVLGALAAFAKSDLAIPESIERPRTSKRGRRRAMQRALGHGRRTFPVVSVYRAETDRLAGARVPSAVNILWGKEEAKPRVVASRLIPGDITGDIQETNDARDPANARFEKL